MTFACFGLFNCTIKVVLNVGPCPLRIHSVCVHVYMTLFLRRLDPSLHHFLKGAPEPPKKINNHCLKYWCFQKTTSGLFLLLWLSSWGDFIHFCDFNLHLHFNYFQICTFLLSSRFTQTAVYQTSPLGLNMFEQTHYCLNEPVHLYVLDSTRYPSDYPR